jgi:hypothetical protein
MDSTSLLLGLLIGGSIGWTLGMLIGVFVGSLSGKAEAAKRLVNEWVLDAAKHLEHDEVYNVSFCIGKQFVGDDDDGGDGEEELEPLVDGSVRFN